MSVSGGGHALANRWTGNRWDGAAGWDADRDGRLDTPYRIDRLSDELFARYPELRLFELSPAASALDALGRFFPTLEPQPIVVDSTPARLVARPPEESPGVRHLGGAPRAAGGSPVLALFWLGLAGLSIWGARRWPL